MPELTTDYVKQLRERYEEINTLRTTPNLMRDMAIQTLDSAIRSRPNNSTLTVLQNGKQALSNITDNSIANNYKIIYAQMCILAVSNLETTLKRYFENVANTPHNLLIENKKLGQMKISIEEVIAANLRFGGKLGSIILEKDKFSLQDLKSIKDVFKTYFGKDIGLSESEEKKACFYLEVRHNMVHKGGIADTKFIRAVNSYNANAKRIRQGERIELDERDWRAMQIVFLKIVQGLTTLTS